MAPTGIKVSSKVAAEADTVVGLVLLLDIVKL